VDFMARSWAGITNSVVRWAGSLVAVSSALTLVVLWLFSGLAFGYSADWLLLAGTVTGVVTFLLVFLIQYSQNRDTRAIQIKLDELLRAVEGSRTGLVRLEERSEAELAEAEREFESIREEES
jgi:low affinity Fe/Cu permease